ncbi:unnamed protein product [Paramecium primaurelia]|uniref:Tetratricopeptide repeat protein n=1 Tax=Paramecium primaurelia TaxID=5886 RepID=A0A8S1Q969_PARPR|nr:unnamed protein product [Paramecium primaurelia]
MQNEISKLKCQIHQENKVQFICMSTECQASKLCCLNCQEIHDIHHDSLKDIDCAWEEIIQHKQQQIELNKTLENFWSQIQVIFPQLDKIISFNRFLVELEKELKQQLNCQDLDQIIQKHKAIFVLFDEKVQICKKKYCQPNELDVDKMLSLFDDARKLYKKGDKQNAIDKYTEVLELNENFIFARLDRGKMNLGLNYEQAQFDYEEVLKQDDRNFRALKGLAICQKMKCNYSDALFYAQKGHKQNSYSTHLVFHLADCYKFEGRSQQALHFINLAIGQKKRKYENKMKVYYKNKAEIHLGLNDIQNANFFINKALDIYQHYEIAINIKERINKIAKMQNVIL